MLLDLLIGLVAGALAKAILPGDRGKPTHWFLTMLLGLVGGVIGGLVFGMLGIHAGGLFGHIIVSTTGAVICIALLRYFSR